jgi:hypothetical protein
MTGTLRPSLAYEEVEMKKAMDRGEGREIEKKKRDY